MPPHTNRNADTGADNRPNAPKPLRLAILSFAMAMLVLTAIALACGPAAPGGQSGGDNNVTAATATPEATATNESTATPTPTPCGPQEFQTNPECFLALMPTPSDFREKYDKYGMVRVMDEYEKAQAEARASGASGGTPAPSPTPHTREIRIFVDKDSRLTELTNLLNQHGMTDVNCYKSTAEHLPYCTEVVPVSLLKTLADTGWVLKMMSVGHPALSSAPQAPPWQTIRDPHGVANWSPFLPPA